MFRIGPGKRRCDRRGFPAPHPSLLSVLLACLISSATAGDYSSLDPVWSSHSVLAVRRMAVLSSQVNNKLKAMHFEMGQSFAKGDILVEFDDLLPRAGVVSAEAAFDAAQASFVAVDSLYQRDNASLVERETARRDMEAARYRLISSRHELDACTIAAPFAGRVVEVYVNAHELVARGAKLMTIVDDSRLLAKFLLPESDFGKVGVGDPVEVEVPVLGLAVPGAITHVSAVLEPASRTFDVWAGIDNRGGMLRAGMIAGLTLIGGVTP